MPDVQVPPRGTVKLDRVEGELKVGKGARLESTGDKIIVNGGVNFDGDARVDCDFECDSLKVGQSARRGGTLRVKGSLIAHHNIEVSRALDVETELRAEEIDVGGTIKAGSIICKSMKVGGTLRVGTTLESSESVEVGWQVKILGKVKLHNLVVGGLAEIGGGLIDGKIEAKMKFDSRSELDFGELNIYGKATLRANSKGRKISTFGKLIVDGNISCEEMQVQGVTDVRGDCKSSSMEVNGKLDMAGSLSVTDKIAIYGSAEVANEVKGSNLEVAGKLGASQIIISGDTNITGTVYTKHGLKARSIVIGSGSNCEGPLIGENIEVGKSGVTIMDWGKHWAGQQITMRLIGRPTRVQDVYCSYVYLREFANARRIFSKDIELEKGCWVDQLTYTGELKMPEGEKRVYINHTPERVERLPSPPL